MKEPLRITLADAASLLEAERVPYALIGGLAASLRGRPRVTADVDMVIAVELDRAVELIAALDRTALQPLFADVAEIVQRAFLLPLRHRTTGVRLDLAVGLSGFERQLVARADRMEIAGTTVPVATTEDLILMKVLAGRAQDEQDLVGLVLAQRDRLDWEYCLTAAIELGEAIGQDLAGKVRSLRDL